MCVVTFCGICGGIPRFTQNQQKVGRRTSAHYLRSPKLPTEQRYMTMHSYEDVAIWTEAVADVELLIPKLYFQAKRPYSCHYRPPRLRQPRCIPHRLPTAYSGELSSSRWTPRPDGPLHGRLAPRSRRLDPSGTICLLGSTIDSLDRTPRFKTCRRSRHRLIATSPRPLGDPDSP